MKPNIILPAPDATANNITVNDQRNIVIIGANGAGKTRMGSWIENNQPNPILIHRISAQRALSIPEALCKHRCSQRP
jgi:ATPase subunit of ABC transporter with duplicated ATPase domains